MYFFGEFFYFLINYINMMYHISINYEEYLIFYNVNFRLKLIDLKGHHIH